VCNYLRVDFVVDWCSGTPSPAKKVITAGAHTVKFSGNFQRGRSQICRTAFWVNDGTILCSYLRLEAVFPQINFTNRKGETKLNEQAVGGRPP